MSGEKSEKMIYQDEHFEISAVYDGEEKFCVIENVENGDQIIIPQNRINLVLSLLHLAKEYLETGEK